MQMDMTILIVDDIEINRAILTEIFQNEYNIIEASNGVEAVEVLNKGIKISAMLLDLLMPEMNGIEVLKEMNRNGLIKKIPVFLITASNSNDMLMEGYEYGAVDIITKPFSTNFLRCRVNNVIELYRHRNELEDIVAEQVERLSNLNNSMIETLATVIEFRDCESGEHVKRISGLTRLLLELPVQVSQWRWLPVELPVEPT